MGEGTGHVAPASPTVAIWELGLRLRERREHTGLTATAAAKQAGCTQGYLSDVERGKTKIAPEKLDALLAAYEFDKAEADELRELRDEANRRAWWSEYSGIFGADMLRFFGYEHGAEWVGSCESLLIPGLLQTESYARALFGGNPDVRVTEVEPLLEARLRRQRRLTDDDPLRLAAVVNEGALRQQVGGPKVLADQLRHLAAMIEQHPQTVEFRVIPFAAGRYRALGASTFHVLRFSSARLPTLVWQDSVASSDLFDRPSQVREYAFAYSEADDLALSRQDSLAAIRQAVKEL